MTFLGFKRPDGSCGARNFVLVMPSGFVADRICSAVAGTKAVITPQGAGGRPAEDRETIARTYIGLGLNPNVAAVLITSSAGGYPETRSERMVEEIASSGKRVEILKDCPSTLDTVANGIKVAREMVHEASKLRRSPCLDRELAVGVKCGSSDPTSGIAGNPVVGYAFDKLVENGGSAFFGENTEIIGAEHILAKRAVNEKVGKDILNAAWTIEELAKSTGEDIRTINPVPGNIKAGITTLEEKSLGAIHKAGTKPIQGVLKYSERPKVHGLYFVDNWMPMSSIFLGYEAAGAQVVLHQQGGGSAPTDGFFYIRGSTLAPLLWCSANKNTKKVGGFNLDFYSGEVMEGKETIEEAGERLYAMILDVASGTVSRMETLSHAETTEFYMRQPVF